jgi:hypothetical protein
MRISTPCRPASSQNRPIKSVDHDDQQAVENDKNPHRKTGVPKESIDHECASSVKTIGAKYTRTGTDLNGSKGLETSVRRTDPSAARVRVTPYPTQKTLGFH